MNMESRTCEQQTFTTSDGVALFYRHWPALQETPRRVVVMFHRGHEHSGRLQHIVDELGLTDSAFYAWDARGHGHSPGERGHSPSVARSVQDVDEFVRFAAAHSQLPLSEVLVIGQSVGAVLVAAWAHDYAPKIRGMILASPAFKVKLYVPFARPGLALMKQFRGLFFVNSYVKGKYLTHDPQRVASFNSDPLITRAIAVNILLELYQTARRVVDDAAAITLPTQLLISGDDFVVHRAPQLRFYQGLRSPVKEVHLLEGFYHDTLGEKDRQQAFTRMRDFIERLYTLPRQAHDYQQEDRWSPSADAWRLLQVPPGRFTPKGLYYSALTLGLNTLGRASSGLRLGLESGFDSGSTLDYVYRNQPQGSGIFGRVVDRGYLNSIGWKGIRVRKTHLQQTIAHAVKQLQEKQLPVRVVDIAAGHGRYVLDALAGLNGVESILLRDYSERNIEAGQAMIAERGMAQLARFEKGDAFNYPQLAALDPAPTLGIVSGLYELFNDNQPIRASLAGLAVAIPPGGLLIYTGQPWHPQLEIIAHTLTSHRDGIPWVMRIRSQGEMDALVEEAGFEKCQQLIDEWGIFSVSLAVRRHHE
ncbi:bifunctional alpha/beta hydrolase/class I SAM-dependent methyltransferase [Entomohabitans teleogrylli]|uniref:bifunctional alpha/beta hydrolase/class I SAM-dependent methyltransferase n=1 Tax=Entomohabitans teleogrylli TaxID=1384589 RepID=UPI00073D771C|nr:bifunctional alpha/beta hydrolase/class I SAM-dependent methyltransferase [Entomohabitans teleogrylli]